MKLNTFLIPFFILCFILVVIIYNRKETAPTRLEIPAITVTNVTINTPALKSPEPPTVVPNQALYGAACLGWIVGTMGGSTNDLNAVFVETGKGNADAVNQWAAARMKKSVAPVVLEEDRSKPPTGYSLLSNGKSWTFRVLNLTSPISYATSKDAVDAAWGHYEANMPMTNVNTGK